MTTEQKAKAYDKALEKARIAHKDEDKHLKAALEKIFPELVESEDGRIRKALIDFFNKGAENGEQTNGVYDIDILAWLEKQDEQKPTDKVEPKFNFSVGQWIVATGKCVYLITKIDGFNVTLVNVDGNEYVFDTSSLEKAHPWTIADAKNGDVLCGYPYDDFPWIGIFHELNDDCTFSSYCYLQAGADGKFCPPSGINIFNKRNVDSHSSKYITPATKEQRSLLFQKMEEAGYEWNDNKKELKKIEQEPQSIVSAEVEEVDKSARSEEDTVTVKLQRIIDFLWHNRKGDTDTIFQQEQDIAWLKSLKQRLGGG